MTGFERAPEDQRVGLHRVVTDCLECHRVCLESIGHCLERGGDYADAAHITRLLDCAQSCQLTADLLLRHSELAGQMAELCAEFCDRCADDCDSWSGDEQTAECAQVARRCAESCRELVTG